MRFGSLFSGIGGLDLGLERAGMECAWQVEIDPFCRKVLTKHWPSVPKFEDVREVGKHNLERVDLVAGGFPCQDISIAGRREGIDGERSGLWREFARIISELRPRLVLVENVSALLSNGMGRVLGDLAEVGYDAEWDCISAKDVGAPHLRERIFVVAYLCQMGQFKARNAEGAEHGYHKERNGQACEQGGTTIQLRTSTNTNVHAPDHRQERVQRIFQGPISRFSEFSWCKDVRRVADLRGRSDIPEPLFRGSGDGIPDWVDRIGSIGNAVVPQVAEWIGKRILEAA